PFGLSPFRRCVVLGLEGGGRGALLDAALCLFPVHCFIFLKGVHFGPLDAGIALRLALTGLPRILLSWLVLAVVSRRVVCRIGMTGIFLARIVRTVYV